MPQLKALKPFTVYKHFLGYKMVLSITEALADRQFRVPILMTKAEGRLGLLDDTW